MIRRSIIPDILFWCGVCEKQWYLHPVTPGGYACISPIYGQKRKYVNNIRVPPGTLVLQDSGAFTDAGLAEQNLLTTYVKTQFQRLSPANALRRQDQHAQRFDYIPAYRGTYDVLIDEYWSEHQGILVREKRRWSELEAQWAVDETVRAADFLHHHRNGIPLVLSLQDVSAKQYLACAQRILPYFREGDMIGLGGFCITGKMPAQIMPVLRETIPPVFALLAREGVTKVHVWGVCYAPALAFLLRQCVLYGLELSTDSVGPTIKILKGEWGYSNWIDPYYKDLVIPRYPEIRQKIEVLGYDHRPVVINHDMGSHRVEHVRQTRLWLANFKESPSYKRLIAQEHQPQQLALV